MGVPTSEVAYIIATTRRETTKVHKNIWWQWKKQIIIIIIIIIYLFILISRRALIYIYSINLSTSYHVIFLFLGDMTLDDVLLRSQQPQERRSS